MDGLTAIEGLCRVCGSALGGANVQCPRCETPHHADCWRYNGGCAVYGCLASEASAVLPRVVEDIRPVLASPREPFPKELAFLLGGAVLAALFKVSFLGQACLVAAAVAYISKKNRTRVIQLELALDPMPEAAEELVLEQKAVSSLVGRGDSETLAQAYSLFEQRHPQLVLEPEIQRELALELLGKGWPALGLEALDKTIRGQAPRPEQKLTRLRHDVLIQDPALYVEGVSGPPEISERTVWVAPPEMMSLRESLDVPGDRACLLVRLWPIGPNPFQVESMTASLDLPGRGVSPRAQLLAGPFEGDALIREWAQAWDAGHPMLALPLDELSLPSEHFRLQMIHISQKGLRFGAGKGEELVPWEDVTDILYCRIGHEEKHQTVEREVTIGIRGERRVEYVTETRRESKYEPLLEIHTRNPALRLRIDRHLPGLFGYLGRRRDMSHAPNLTMATKDLIRFAPRARFSHGLLHMLSERAGTFSRFEEIQRFEEYALWFHAMGTRRVRETFHSMTPVER